LVTLNDPSARVHPLRLQSLQLADFRLFSDVVFSPATLGTTVVTGPNGTGKTSLLEAVAYLGSQRSFRGAPKEALVRLTSARAVIRAHFERDQRALLVEAEIPLDGRSRAQINRQIARTRRDLAEAVPSTVFSPADLAVVQGGPARRRELLDDALVLWRPSTVPLLDNLDKTLRQRAALLRQAGRLTPEVLATLDVWDDRLESTGSALVRARQELIDALAPYVEDAYMALVAERMPVTLELDYRCSWRGSLRTVLGERRQDDLRRGATGVGPHRDDLSLSLSGRDTRVQASQGEQRSVAFALRLGAHRLVADTTGTVPILLLDDVFSELDPQRSRALVEHLPEGQAILSTASALPDGIEPALVLDVRDLAPTAPGSGSL
jgi:DNA replication and repair protein RecF